MPKNTFAFDKVTVGATSVGVTAANLLTSTPATPSNAPVADPPVACSRVECYVEGHPIRIRYDGGAPVAGSTGDVIAAGGSFSVDPGKDVAALRMISEDGSNATVHVSYLRGA